MEKKSGVNIMRTGAFSFSQNKNAVKNFVGKYNLLVLIVTLIVISTILSKGVFISLTNIRNLLIQNSILGIIAMGQFLVLLTGGIDLSVGAILAAGSMLCAYFLVKAPIGILFSVIACLVLSSSLGFINGIIVSKGKIPSFIVTLGMMGIARSIAREISPSPIWEVPKEFFIFGRGNIGQVPVPLFLWGIVVLFVVFLVERTYVGRYIYAVGANENVARLSGIKINRIKLLVYTLSGLFCGIGALIFIGRNEYATPTAGISYHLDSLVAVIIGGTSLAGGRGKVVGAFLGVMIMGILINFLRIMNINLFWQQAMEGAILLIALYGVRKITIGKQ